MPFSTNPLGFGPISTDGIFTTGGQLSLDMSGDSNVSIPDSGVIVTQTANSSYSPVIRGGNGSNFTGITSVTQYFKFFNGLTYVSVDINWTGVGSASGQVQITLPSTVTNKCGFSLYWYGGVFITVSGNVSITIGADNGTNYAVLPLSDGAGTMSHLQVGNVSLAGEIIFSGFYY